VYCHACGEKRLDERDLTLSAFAHYALEAITNADAKLYATLRALFARPGLLTREFVAGRRTPYLGPLQLFIACNLLFFLLLQLGWGTNALTTDLIFHQTQPVYGPLAAERIAERVGPIVERPHGMTFPGWLGQMTPEQRELRERFNEASPRYANSLVFLMVPLFALALRLLRRRAIFVRELVFSLHFFSFLLLLAILLPLPAYAAGWLAPRYARFFESDDGVVVFLAVAVASYVGLALRRSHGDSRQGALLRGFAAPLLLLAVFTIYRAILFFVVFAAI